MTEKIIRGRAAILAARDRHIKVGVDVASDPPQRRWLALAAGGGYTIRAIAAMSWRVCHATAFEPEAYVVKGFLEHQGIPCLLESSRFGIDPVRIGSLRTIRILVPEEWVPVASKLISRRTRWQADSGLQHPRGQLIVVDFRRRRRKVRPTRKP